MIAVAGSKKQTKLACTAALGRLACFTSTTGCRSLLLQMFDSYAAAVRERHDVKMIGKILHVSRFIAVPVGLIIGLYTLLFTTGERTYGMFLA